MKLIKDILIAVLWVVIGAIIGIAVDNYRHKTEIKKAAPKQERPNH